MENKINIAEILKDCPSGMELYSPLFGDCTFVEVRDNKDQIIVKLETGATVWFQTDGRYYDYPNAECILFPKGKTTWEGFVPPCKFKEGDVVVSVFGDIHLLRTGDSSYCAYRMYWTGATKFDNTITTSVEVARLSTEEEKQKLFQAIKDNGYKWNPKTKTLEKLVKPKFKVGDIIQDITGICKVKITEVNVEDKCYLYKSLNINGIGGITFNRQDDWELVPNKFDINILKPFDKVLVRSDNSDVWECDFFSLYNPKCSNRFHCIGAWYNICIPYIGNEHLRGTTDDCDDFYKTWE